MTLSFPIPLAFHVGHLHLPYLYIWNFFRVLYLALFNSILTKQSVCVFSTFTEKVILLLNIKCKCANKIDWCLSEQVFLVFQMDNKIIYIVDF